MEFLLNTGSAKYQIRSYHQGLLKVNEVTYSSSIIVMPDLIIAPWGPTSVETLNACDFDELLDLKPQVVLLGSGSHFQLLTQPLIAMLTASGMALEVMDTAAACRTYAVLMSEGRNVAAALLT